MKSDRKARLKLRLFVGALACVVLGSLILSTPVFHDLVREFLPWLFLTVLFGLAERSDLLFHYERGRQGISASEAVLIPIVVGFSLGQTVLGTVVAITVVSGFDSRVRGFKGIFNIAQYGCAAAAAAGVWHVFAEEAVGLTPRNAAVAGLSAVTFALLTHLMVSVAIALAESRPLLRPSIDVAPALFWNTTGNIALGLMFAASFLAARWTVVLFVLPISFFFYGYRAVVRQMGERERIEKLHEATRALVASPDLDHAVVGFLAAVEDIASASEAWAVIGGRDGYRYTAVHDGEPVKVMEPIAGTPLDDLMREVRRADGSLVVGQDEEGPRRKLIEALGARSLVAVTLDEEEGGCLVVLDRVGADEFGPAEAKMLQALAQELALSLDSHRLFSQIVEERERFLRIFAGSREGICLLDAHGKVVAWNPALEAITGYTTTEMAGSVLSERLMVRTEDQHRLNTTELVEAQPDEVLEIVTRGGPPRWVALMADPVSAGPESGHVILVRDVTRERELEQAKSDFLATISHELRTPLTAIKGSLQILGRAQGEVPDPVRQQMVGVMQRGSDRLERLVLNLLFVSQIELDGAPRMVADEIDLERLLRNRMTPIVPEHTSVELVTPDEPLVVRGDRERLSQVIEHLLDNAVKFGAGAPIKVEISRTNGFAQLAVSDRGPGIPKADQERIFERFVRLGATLRRETQGAGVGLFIVKESVTAMGGSVTVDSEPGNGATFRITIPLARPMAVPATG